MTGHREVVVTRSGSLTTVQDAGRAGLAHLAIPPSGALDRPAWRLANRLVGNAEEAAALETTLTGVGLRACVSVVAAVTGARAPVTVDGRAEGWGVPIPVAPGQEMDVGLAVVGLRSYVALSGGITVGMVLGSRASDSLSGLGPPPLQPGCRLPLGPVPGPVPAVDFAPYPLPPDRLRLVLHPGPRWDWLSEDGVRALANAMWRVSSDSNRIGLRLDGPAVGRRASRGELASEGMVTGAVQVTASGQPIIFLADHPTTGGYPVVGVVDAPGVTACSQARPGTPVAFRLDDVAGSGAGWARPPEGPDASGERDEP
ncbi:MAG: biotin-dependent carboxyltransferase family protein [Acidimicrobiales bacterium]